MIQKQTPKNLGKALTSDNRQLGMLVQPSLLSGVVAILMAGTISLGTAALLIYRGSYWQYLAQLQRDKASSVGDSYQTLTQGVAGGGIVADLPLLVFWGVLGAIVYSFLSSLLRSVQGTATFRKQLSYVNSNRQLLIGSVLRQLLVRLVSLLLLLVLIRFTTDTILPYSIALVYAALGLDSVAPAIGYILGSIGLGVITLHLYTVLARLLVGRTRLFL